MALDATPAGANANSYLDLATANSMAAAAGFATWATLADADKSAALIRATLDIDSHRFHHPTPYSAEILTFVPAAPSIPLQQLILGQNNWDIDPALVRSKQALKFPRRKDISGAIPKAILWACLTQADFIASSGEYDRKQWTGVKDGAPLPQAGVGSSLCPRAFGYLAPYIKKGGVFSK